MGGVSAINLQFAEGLTAESQLRRAQVLALINRQVMAETALETALLQGKADTDKASALLGSTSYSDSLSLGTVSGALASANLTPEQLAMVMQAARSTTAQDPFKSAANLVYESLASGLADFNG